jgi:transposase-like protein
MARVIAYDLDELHFSQAAPGMRVRMLAQVRSGESVSAVSRRFGVSKATIERWWASDGPPQPSNARALEELGALVGDCVVNEILRAVSAQARRGPWEGKVS